MKSVTLDTSNPDVLLVQPDVNRDASLGVQWLEGISGRDTLRMMGVADSENKPSTIEDERNRVSEFITREDQLNWMIAYGNHIVGAIWVDLEPTEYLPEPAVHIMIGDQQARGKGIGKASIRAVIDYLKKTGVKQIFSRHLVENEGSTRLLKSSGFDDLGEVYKDADELSWQNVLLTIE